nr:hypothetical protein CFP56_30173 [Quercus suber]
MPGLGFPILGGLAIDGMRLDAQATVHGRLELAELGEEAMSAGDGWPGTVRLGGRGRRVSGVDVDPGGLQFLLRGQRPLVPVRGRGGQDGWLAMLLLLRIELECHDVDGQDGSATCSGAHQDDGRSDRRTDGRTDGRTGLLINNGRRNGRAPAEQGSHAGLSHDGVRGVSMLLVARAGFYKPGCPGQQRHLLAGIRHTTAQSRPCTNLMDVLTSCVQPAVDRFQVQSPKTNATLARRARICKGHAEGWESSHCTNARLRTWPRSEVTSRIVVEDHHPMLPCLASCVSHSIFISCRGTHAATQGVSRARQLQGPLSLFI